MFEATRAFSLFFLVTFSPLFTMALISDSAFAGIHSRAPHSIPGTCGASGAIEKRIKDCEQLDLQAIRGPDFIIPQGWKLISRLAKGRHHRLFFETWIDTETGLIWGDAILKPQIGKNWINEYNGVVAEQYCGHSELAENGGLRSIHFRIPSAEDFEREKTREFREVLPNFLREMPDLGKPGNYHFMPVSFWTSTPTQVHEAENGPVMKLYDPIADSTESEAMFRNESVGSVVRCVADANGGE